MSNNNIAPDSELHLQKRAGLPDDLAFLVKKYPKENWQAHKNMGDATQFWLSRHAMFRELSTGLLQASSELKEQELKPAEFRDWFVPRYWFFLQQLNAHHQIEDGHYFPLLIKAEDRLKSGFELLESDHGVIHEGLLSLQDIGIKFDHALQNDPARILFIADDVTKALSSFLNDLTRHLADEEDLVVPLILDRSEMAIGLA